jgi:hypothetical protein
METEAPASPLKVCPRCAVATRTDAAMCPSCGKPYQRRLWRWWMAIPIIAVAFAIGYFGISNLFDEDDPGTITAEQGSAIELGVSRGQLEERLGEPLEVSDERAGGAATCLYYGIGGQPGSAWEFCFADDSLVTSKAVGGAAD